MAQAICYCKYCGRVMYGGIFTFCLECERGGRHITETDQETKRPKKRSRKRKVPVADIIKRYRPTLTSW